MSMELNTGCRVLDYMNSNLSSKPLEVCNFFPSSCNSVLDSEATTKRNISKLCDMNSSFIKQSQNLNIKQKSSSFGQSEATEYNYQSAFTNKQVGAYNTKSEFDSELSVSAEGTSDESVLTLTQQKQSEIVRKKNNEPKSPKPLRLFNKNGKPLTDRSGRPLVDILGQLLIALDNEGRVVSDAKGYQVFNSLGESAIHSSTNLNIPPSGEEPGIPLLDMDKKHILFLYDNKGYPLTDSMGRVLIKGSGKPMLGIHPKEKVNVDILKRYSMKNIYSRAPLENFVRRVQIFDNNGLPLTDENGRLLENREIICNKSGMPMCDAQGLPLCFRYGARIITNSNDSEDSKNNQKKECILKTQYALSNDLVIGNKIEDRAKYFETNTQNLVENINLKSHNGDINKKVYTRDTQPEKEEKYSDNVKTNSIQTFESDMFSLKETPLHLNKKSNTKDNETDLEENKNCSEYQNITNNFESLPNENLELQNKSLTTNLSKEETFREPTKINISDHMKNSRPISLDRQSEEAIVLFDATKRMENQEVSTMNTAALKGMKTKNISLSIVKRKQTKKMYTSNFIEYFKNALNLTNMKWRNGNRFIYNEYGKPMKDIYGNFLYDKYGIPLTGSKGKKLSEKTRHTIRLKLRNIPVVPVARKAGDKETTPKALTCMDSSDLFGDSFYDNYGRPLYDLFGKLIYDVYGRPLTDAFGRPLIDALGQPLMDAEGHVLTSVTDPLSKNSLTDIFGRRLYDKHGRALFDSYGRPRYDIYTNAIYDNCGRPVTDGNGQILHDFLNKPIQPHPEKPLYRNAKILLPRYIDTILTMPSLNRVLKYSRLQLTDVFGGPLFDDFGRPLYNKIGKPLHDRYGRPLYDKDGKPLCDCYGRPVSEEIRQSVDDQTLSVVDSLKLLKLTKESTKWMEIKRSQMQYLKSSEISVLDNAVIMKVVQPQKMRSTQYIYALTRVTRFACGRQALEILEAPLSPSTAAEMHYLPVDNKPLIIMAKQRHKVIRKRRPANRK